MAPVGVLGSPVGTGPAVRAGSSGGIRAPSGYGSYFGVPFITQSPIAFRITQMERGDELVYGEVYIVIRGQNAQLVVLKPNGITVQRDIQRPPPPRYFDVFIDSMNNPDRLISELLRRHDGDPRNLWTIVKETVRGALANQLTHDQAITEDINRGKAEYERIKSRLEQPGSSPPPGSSTPQQRMDPVSYPSPTVMGRI